MPVGTKPVTRKQFKLGADNVNVVTAERIGSQTPTNCWVPEYDRTVGDKCMEFLDAVGVNLDPWQRYCLVESLGLKPSPGGREKWSAKEVALLVPRQQGKTVIVEARELLGLFLLNEKLIIHCLDSDTPILTESGGWKKISEISPGEDRVFHPSGRAIDVVGKSPVWLRQNCFKVRTTDGRELIADADHLWTVTDRRRHRSIGPRGSQKEFFETVTLTTKELYESGLERYPNRSYKGFRYVLPHQGAVETAEVELPVDPYVLGAWLGDGTSRNGSLTTHADDIPHWVREIGAAGYEVTEHVAGCRIGILGLHAQLRELGLIQNKHVPANYLVASPRQRESLLQGLMDTDGCTSNGRAQFDNTNKQLAESVLFLARSLGWRATMNECAPTRYQRQVHYRVTWMPKAWDAFKPVRMERKLANLSDIPVRGGRDSFCISSIAPVDSVPVSCIRVDSPDGLFLAGDGLMPTHNSAQLFPTANESYLRMCRLIESCPELDKLVHKKRSGNNNVGIELKNGARLLYMARGRDPGRGFSGDLVVLDEAYSLAPEMIGALIPALSARPNPQIWYASSTGHEDSDVLLKARDRGLANEPGIALFEWCADTGASLDDREQWYKANPALGIRLEEDYIELERRSMSDKEFARERLGLWADTQVHAPIDEELWRSLCHCGGESHPECKKLGPMSQITSQTVVAIDASPDRSWATVAIAGYTADGNKQVEVIQDGRGLPWCVDTVERLFAGTTNPPPLAVCVQSGARAGALIPELEALGVKVIPFGTREIMGATGFFYDSCQDGSLVHLGDKSLAQGLSGARQYMIGGKVGDGEYNGWGWTRTDPTVNITGVCAVTYALWGLNMMRTEALTDRKSYEGKPRGGRIW